LVRQRRATPAALEAERGDLAGVLPGVAGLQPAVRRRHGRLAAGTARAAQHPGADPADDLPVHPLRHPPAGTLAGAALKPRGCATGAPALPCPRRRPCPSPPAHLCPRPPSAPLRSRSPAPAAASACTAPSACATRASR